MKQEDVCVNCGKEKKKHIEMKDADSGAKKLKCPDVDNFFTPRFSIIKKTAFVVYDNFLGYDYDRFVDHNMDGKEKGKAEQLIQKLYSKMR